MHKEFSCSSVMLLFIPVHMSYKLHICISDAIMQDVEKL